MAISRRGAWYPQIWKSSGYCSRWRFILDRCKERSVLHLGFVGETDGYLDKKMAAFGDGQILHTHLAQAQSEVTGLDRDERAVQTI